jgi:hypothetical protein
MKLDFDIGFSFIAQNLGLIFAMKSIQYAANDLLMKEGPVKALEEWYDRSKEQSDQSHLEEVEKRIVQLEILNARD